jgi:diaminopimelate epimerase
MSIAEEKYATKTTFMLPFEKMQGLGNDFVIINSSHLDYNGDEAREADLCKRICDRYIGIGADGMIVIDAPLNSAEAVKSWRFYNADGSVGEMCGNGIRCAAKYIYEHGLSSEETNFKIETLAGDIGIEMLDGDQVKVNMGAPREIKAGQSFTLSDDKTVFNYDYVSMGNPHAVNFPEVSNYDELRKSSQIGSEVEVHSKFPHKTNVEFALVNENKEIDLIVWERACGFTQACGTGACATVTSAILQNKFEKDEEIKVNLPGGTLKILWDSVTENLFMTGAAKMSFIGYYNDER